MAIATGEGIEFYFLNDTDIDPDDDCLIDLKKLGLNLYVPRYFLDKPFYFVSHLIDKDYVQSLIDVQVPHPSHKHRIMTEFADMRLQKYFESENEHHKVDLKQVIGEWTEGEQKFARDNDNRYFEVYIRDRFNQLDGKRREYSLSFARKIGRLFDLENLAVA